MTKSRQATMYQKVSVFFSTVNQFLQLIRIL